MSEKINRLEVVSSFFGNPVDPTTKMDKIQYKINNKDIISLKYPAEIKYKPYIVNGGLIYDKGNKPAYGFKIVYNKYGQCLFMRMKDNVTMPYIFDFATNFNKYGLAMVAKDGNVTWINKNFQYFSNRRDISRLTEEYRINGWASIDAFSGGDIKLSRCQSSFEIPSTSFLGTDFQVKTFYEYDGSRINEDKHCNSLDGVYSNFNEKGYATSSAVETILSSKGYYANSQTLIEKAIKENPQQYLEYLIANEMLSSSDETVRDRKTFQKQ